MLNNPIRVNSNTPSYNELFTYRISLSKKQYIKKLLDMFFLNEENTFLFNMIRLEIKKNIKTHPFLYEDWLLKRFGVNKKALSRKPRIAFVDHSFHSKTASSMFFVHELEKYYNVDIFWSSRWKGVPDGYLKKLHKTYRNAIYWQIFPDLKYNHPINTVIVPMWDSIWSEKDEFYENYRQYSFLCFSHALYKKCLEQKLSSKYLKFMPNGQLENNKESTNNKSPSIYFWQRTSEITWTEVKKIIGGNKVKKVVICNAVDPGFEFIKPCHEDIKKYNIEIVSWSESYSSFQNILKNIDIYIAPRKFEGIGFSFLEAIKLGCTIICNNQSTMNEYVDDKVGYLVDYENPTLVDFYDWKNKKLEMQKRYLTQNHSVESEFYRNFHSTIGDFFK
jgi:hypothetical protein|tara:strand:- start:7338 stop:8507 length:1170 start_codon:yes stop_codon:yes gene_type:complete